MYDFRAKREEWDITLFKTANYLITSLGSHLVFTILWRICCMICVIITTFTSANVMIQILIISSRAFTGTKKKVYVQCKKQKKKTNPKKQKQARLKTLQVHLRPVKKMAFKALHDSRRKCNFIIILKLLITISLGSSIWAWQEVVKVFVIKKKLKKKSICSDFFEAASRNVTASYCEKKLDVLVQRCIIFGGKSCWAGILFPFFPPVVVLNVFYIC